MKYKSHLSRFLFYVGYIFLYIPILLILLYAFNDSNTIVWTGISLRWFRILANNTLLFDATVTSLHIATISATLSVVLGTLCAHAWTSQERPNRFLGLLATMPLVIPEVIVGLSLLIFFVTIERQGLCIPRGIITIIMAHTTLGIAYVTAIVRVRLNTLSPFLREAALDLGARPYLVFWKITLPLIMPSLIASWLISFVLSFDDVVLASFMSGPGASTLPLVIFSSLKVGYTPQINALATCIVILASIIVVATGCIMYQRSDSSDEQGKI